MNKQKYWYEKLKPLLAFLSFVSIGWVVFILWDAWPATKGALTKVHVQYLIASIFGFVFAAYVAFEGFYLLFKIRFDGFCKKSQLGNLYFSSQMMKHIPGRVWGVAYQAVMLPEVSLYKWIGLNALHTILSIVFAVVIAGVILIFRSYSLIAVVLFFLFIFGYFFLWRNGVLNLIFGFIKKSKREFVKQTMDDLSFYFRISVRDKLLLLIIFLFWWALYYLSWALFGLSWPGLGFVNGVYLCAAYMIAWFVGYLSFFTPSGLGVREAVFVALSIGYPPEAIAAIILYGRFALTFADIVLGMIHLPFKIMSSELVNHE